MAGKACSNQLLRSDMNASGPVLLRTGFKSVLGGGGMSRQLQSWITIKKIPLPPWVLVGNFW